MAMSERRSHAQPSMSSATRAGVVAIAVGVLLQVGCAGQEHAAPAAAQVQSGPAKAEDFLVVDCLLPGQVRKIGRDLTYLAPRRAIKTSGRDCEIKGGEYVSYDRANYATALKVWLPLAEQGDAAAQSYVGEIFERGLGIPADYGAAATWYQRAAERGNSRAAINLGNLYEQGLGVPKDPPQALNWYRRAAGLSELTFDLAPGKTAAELQELRRQVAELRGQLQTKQAELDRTQREIEQLQGRLGERKREADSLQERIELLQAELKAATARKPDEPARKPDEPRVVEIKRSLSEAEALKLAKEQEVAALREQIATMEGRGGLKREVQNVRRELDQAEAQLIPLRAGLQPLKHEVTQGGPAIQLMQVQVVEPEVLSSTRAIQAAQVTVPAATRSWLVVGRVASEAGLKSLAINERPQTPNRESLFRTLVTDADRHLRIVATDRRDRISTLEFSLPAKQNETGSPRESVSARLTTSQLSQLTRSMGTYHALVIGNNNYRQVPRLQTAVNDAQEVARVLRERYGFRVTLLTDSTRYEMLSALNEFRGKLTKEDNLLIYYAGHGYLDEKNGRGYWLPVDAGPSGSVNWLANDEMTGILDAMDVRQLLLVADSCYSGTLTRSAIGQLKPAGSQEDVLRLIQQMAQKRSRIAMTSGGLEPVLDSAGGRHSAFAEILLKMLRDNDGVLLGSDLFRQVQLHMAEMAGRLPLPQEPQYAPIKPGHEAGEFVFVRSTS
jgi:predicted  nucleic acid-binding Zn-ribbon protein